MVIKILTKNVYKIFINIEKAKFFIKYYFNINCFDHPTK